VKLSSAAHVSLRIALAVFCCVVACSSPVHAADERYSLGTVQVEDSVSVAPGEETATAIGFYNIDGTVPVDVEVTVPVVPAGWSAMLQPRCDSDARILSRGPGSRLLLRLDPMPVYSDRVDCQSACEQRFWLERRGYVCAVAVDLCLAASSDGPREAGPLAVHVLATWETAPPQERDLMYTLVVEAAGAGVAADGEAGASGPPLAALLVVCLVLLAAAFVFLAARRLRNQQHFTTINLS
jgi:hypothetical protein